MEKSIKEAWEAVIHIHFHLIEKGIDQDGWYSNERNDQWFPIHPGDINQYDFRNNNTEVRPKSLGITETEAARSISSKTRKFERLLMSSKTDDDTEELTPNEVQLAAEEENPHYDLEQRYLFSHDNDSVVRLKRIHFIKGAEWHKKQDQSVINKLIEALEKIAAFDSPNQTVLLKANEALWDLTEIAIQALKSIENDLPHHPRK